MFKDRLMTALDDAISHYNEGADENQSVIKSASAHGFNPDQTQRLVESFNTAKTIVFYKNAEDRSVDFPTADPGAVIKELFGDNVEEKKKASDDYVDYTYYDVTHPELDKAAEFLQFDPWADFDGQVYEDKEADARKKMTDYQGLIDARNACDNAALQASTLYQGKLTKVAEELSRNRYYNELLIDEFHTYGTTLNKMANAVVDEIFENYLPESRDNCSDMVITSFDTDFAVVASDVKEAAELLQQATVMQTTSIELEKQAADYAVTTSITEEADELDGFIPKSAENIYGKALNSLVDSTSREATGGVLKGLKGAVQSDDTIKNKYAEKAKNQYRQLLLERLMVTDPILRGAEEESVLRAYETLIELAPEVSLKEDVTRSILREAVTTTAMSPFDAKNYVDLDSAIKKQVAPKPAGQERPTA